jgi:hypothetical protein
VYREINTQKINNFYLPPIPMIDTRIVDRNLDLYNEVRQKLENSDLPEQVKIEKRGDLSNIISAMASPLCPEFLRVESEKIEKMIRDNF